MVIFNSACQTKTKGPGTINHKVKQFNHSQSERISTANKVYTTHLYFKFIMFALNTWLYYTI